MSQIDLTSLSKSELKAYVIAHPNEREAFRTFVDRFTPEASQETFDIPKSDADFATVEMLIRQKLEQLKASSSPKELCLVIQSQKNQVTGFCRVGNPAKSAWQTTS